MSTVYLSGRMRGLPRFGFPIFDTVAVSLRAQGHVVYNPAEHDRDLYPDIDAWPGFETGDPERCPAFNLPDSLAWDFQTILQVDGIAMLYGWERSSGARAERFVAEAVGKDVWLVTEAIGRYALVRDPRRMMDYPLVKEEYNESQRRNRFVG